MTFTNTPELLADLRKHAHALAAVYGVGHYYGVRVPAPLMQINPETVLALLDRLEDLEAKWERPSGGMWVRLG